MMIGRDLTLKLAPRVVIALAWVIIVEGVLTSSFVTSFVWFVAFYGV
jgi:hypothetical protein